jgi:hypothetical protein
MTASAPQPATFSACRRAPTDGITTTPASLSRAIRSGRGASANDATRTPSAMIVSTRSAASGASDLTLTPNGAPVRRLTSRMAERISSWFIVADAMMPSPPACDVAAVSRAPDT